MTDQFPKHPYFFQDPHPTSTLDFFNKVEKSKNQLMPKKEDHRERATQFSSFLLGVGDLKTYFARSDTVSQFPKIGEAHRQLTFLVVYQNIVKLGAEMIIGKIVCHSDFESRLQNGVTNSPSIFLL